MRWIAAPLMLLLACAPAPAQVVYKCVGTNGRTEYSSWPCKPGQVTRQAIPAPPDPVRRHVPPPSPSSSPGPTSPVHLANHWSLPTPARQRRAARDAACSAARRDRDATLARVGLKRNFDLLRRLDDAVRGACGG